MKFFKKHKIRFGIVAVLLVLVIYINVSDSAKVLLYEAVYGVRDDRSAALAAQVKSPFLYSFSTDGVLQEVYPMDLSSSPYFWLNSGGLFPLKGGIGMTNQGELSEFSKWRVAYANNNPVDTDNGYHPQNLFRLVTRSKWLNYRQEVQVKINKINLSASMERNAWSGILLFNRYQDGDNLYYTGVRMDGHVVIKKKSRGTYYTMAEKTFFPGTYNRDTNPNLLPGNTWMGLRSEVVNSEGRKEKVTINFYVDKDNTGNWVLALSVTDDGRSFGGRALTDEGYAGIRGDFMDLEFDNYRLTTL